MKSTLEQDNQNYSADEKHRYLRKPELLASFALFELYLLPVAPLGAVALSQPQRITVMRLL